MPPKHVKVDSIQKRTGGLVAMGGLREPNSSLLITIVKQAPIVIPRLDTSAAHHKCERPDFLQCSVLW